MAIADLCYVDAAGFHSPDYPTVLSELQTSYQSIYGADVYLQPDSQDGQWLAIQALAIFDTIALCESVYNSFSPSIAQGDALSRQVRINGLARLVPSLSQVDLVMVGVTGTTITNGMAIDTLGQQWMLPASVVIPGGGTITVTALAAQAGAVLASANTITQIGTPTLGWQTVNNHAMATPGNPVESDAALRLRQAEAAALPSRSIMEGLVGALASVPGVSSAFGYENATDTTDSNGLPPNSIAMVVQGGDDQAIADIIRLKKTPGTATYGTTPETSIDAYGFPSLINFFRPSPATVSVEITITPLQGYTSAFSTEFAQAVASYISALQIGSDVMLSTLYVPVYLPAPAGKTYNVTLIRLKKNSGSFAVADVPLLFNELPVCDPVANVTVIVT
jgi:uncharacterized phage protein gp47/JayE